MDLDLTTNAAPTSSDIPAAGAPSGSAPPRRVESGPEVADGSDLVSPTIRQVIDEWRPRLAEIRAEWELSLPADSAAAWPRGVAYVRESSARSLAGDAPDVQLKTTLALLGRRGFFVAEEGVFFDVQSATDVVARAAFQRLYEQALAGGIKVIGFSVADRLFRNLEQALQIKRQFKRAGVELIHVGQYEGDTRHPAAWQHQVIQDSNGEYHARNTSYNVGTHFESISREGKPISKLPEAYRAGLRAPAFLGRRGSVISWELIEPLASIIKEGCGRYLAGESLSDLGRWSAGTELKGVTPAGHVMNSRWWYHTLKNPKYAGYQFATRYPGYKADLDPQKMAASRRHEGRDLVPCKLPALWTIADYHEIARLARARAVGVKVRKTYRAYLLTGIAHDARCGDRMRVVKAGSEGHFWMQCHKLGTDGRHAPSARADIAARELDELLVNLRFEEPELLRQVEEEVAALSEASAEARERFRADPTIAAVHQAPAMLAAARVEEGRDALHEKLALLEGADKERRELLNAPVANFRHAVAELSKWSAVWREGGVAAKNEVLRAAGVRVELGLLEGEPGKLHQFHVLSVSAENPVFALALSTALAGSRHWVGIRPCEDPVSTVRLPIDDRFERAAARIAAWPDGTAHGLVRPEFAHQSSINNRPPSLPGGPWLRSPRQHPRWVALATGYSN